MKTPIDLAVVWSFVPMSLDVETAVRLCVTLAHSMWVFALAAVVIAIVRRSSITIRNQYRAAVVMLLIGLAAIPIIYGVQRVGHGSGSYVLESGNVTHAVSTLEKASEEAGFEIPPADITDSAAFVPSISRSAAEAQTSLKDWSPILCWLATGYLVGVGLMLLRLLYSIWKCGRLARLGERLVEGPLVDSLSSIASSIELRALPVLRVCEAVAVPRIVGLIRPTILLPASAATGLTLDQLEMVLAHELAHLRRYDLWVNLLQRIAEAVLFFNPFLWLVSRQISAIREYCCDEAACNVVDQDGHFVREEYAVALVRVAELSQATVDKSVLATLASTGRGPSELRRRIASLLNEPLHEPLRMTRTSGVVITTVAFSALTASGWFSKPEETPVDRGAEFSFGTIESFMVADIDEPSAWWSIDGSPMTDTALTYRGGIAGNREDARRVFAARFSHLPEGSHVVWRLPDYGGAGADGGSLFDASGNRVDRFAIASRHFDRDLASLANVRIGVASGRFYPAKGVPIESEPFGAKDGGTQIVVTDTCGDVQRRYVAYERDGKTKHISSSVKTKRVGPTCQSEVLFKDLDIGRANVFQLEIRDYEWAEIGPIALNPDPAKDPQSIETSVDELNPALAEGEVKKAGLIVVIAKHVMLLDGQKIITWEDLDELVKQVPDPKKAHVQFYMTHGVHESTERYAQVKKQIWNFHNEHNLGGHSEGSLWPRTSHRYDAIESAEDLVPNESQRIGAVVLDAEKNPVADAEIILITPIDESIPYRTYGLALVNGRIRNPVEHVHTRSAGDGWFKLYRDPEQPYYVMAIHPEAGFALVNGQDFDQLNRTLTGIPAIHLLDWGAILATFSDPKTDATIDLNTRWETKGELPEIDLKQYWSDMDRARKLGERTPTSGEFRFDHVPPIQQTTLSTSIKGERGSSFSMPGVSVSLFPGETREIPVGPLSDHQRRTYEFMRERSEAAANTKNAAGSTQSDGESENNSE